MSFVKQRLLFSLIGLSLLPLIGCGGNSSSGTSEQVSTTSTLSTVAPTTTELTTTTTISPGEQRDNELRDLVPLLNDGEQRLRIIKAIEDDFVLERVDRFFAVYFDPPDSAMFLIVSGTSGYNGDDFQLDAVWELATSLAFLWEPSGLLRNDDGLVKPMLEITVDLRVYEAPYELMVRLGERRVTRGEWMSMACLGMADPSGEVGYYPGKGC